MHLKSDDVPKNCPSKHSSPFMKRNFVFMALILSVLMVIIYGKWSKINATSYVSTDDRVIHVLKPIRGEQVVVAAKSVVTQDSNYESETPAESEIESLPSEI